MTDSYPNWFGKNKLKNILAIIDSNKFNYRHKIGELRYISETSAKKSLNTLNEIRNVEIIKYKKRTPGQKELLNLFNDLLVAVLTNKTLKSKSQKEENENDENDDDNANAKNKKTSTNIKKATNKKKMRMKTCC